VVGGFGWISMMRRRGMVCNTAGTPWHDHSMQRNVEARHASSDCCMPGELPHLTAGQSRGPDPLRSDGATKVFRFIIQPPKSPLGARDQPLGTSRGGLGCSAGNFGPRAIMLPLMRGPRCLHQFYRLSSRARNTLQVPRRPLLHSAQLAMRPGRTRPAAAPAAWSAWLPRLAPLACSLLLLALPPAVLGGSEISPSVMLIGEGTTRARLPGGAAWLHRSALMQWAAACGVRARRI
jgi:hypothetical protein